jgi:hypothetical protein
MRYERIHVEINDALIDKVLSTGSDPWQIIEPVWWQAELYDGVDEYELSMLQFSRSQRWIFSLEWYRSEIYNGGHQQFFYNASGVVWKDALTGLEVIEATKLYNVLHHAISLLGGDPPFERMLRCDLLDQLKPDFTESDEQFEVAEEDEDIDELILRYIDRNRQNFYFDGFIRRAIFPW